MSFWGKREMGFVIAGRVGVAKKYLECHEGFAEDGYNESGEKEKYVDMLLIYFVV